jgi:hypothetical protein
VRDCACSADHQPLVTGITYESSSRLQNTDSEMTGMPSQSLENRRTCLYQCIHKGCLNCTSTRPCPPLIVIATRYTEEMNKVSGK